jgi:hypothetical protein
LIDIRKNEMSLAVPGIAVCIVNRRYAEMKMSQTLAQLKKNYVAQCRLKLTCMAVVVKNPNIIMRFREPVCLEKYLASALNALPTLVEDRLKKCCNRLIEKNNIR